MWWLWYLLMAAFWRMIHARRLWWYGRKMDKVWLRSSITSCHLIGIFVTSIQLNITTTSCIHLYQLKIHGWLIGGSVGHFITFYPYKRIIHFLFYANFSTVGCVGRECLHYWSFIGSSRGNLLTIYIGEQWWGGWVLDILHLSVD